MGCEYSRDSQTHSWPLAHPLLSYEATVADRHLRNTHSIPETQLAAVPSPTLRSVSSVAHPHQPGVFKW